MMHRLSMRRNCRCDDYIVDIVRWSFYSGPLLRRMMRSVLRELTSMGSKHIFDNDRAHSQCFSPDLTARKTQPNRLHDVESTLPGMKSGLPGLGTNRRLHACGAWRNHAESFRQALQRDPGAAWPIWTLSLAFEVGHGGFEQFWCL